MDADTLGDLVAAWTTSPEWRPGTRRSADAELKPLPGGRIEVAIADLESIEGIEGIEVE